MDVLATMAIVKALHVVFMVAWFSGLFFLGRMVIYLAEAIREKEISVIGLMEKAIRRVSFIIVWPATILTIGFGLWAMVLTQAYTSPWFHLKMTLVLLLLWQQHYLYRIIKRLKKGEHVYSSLFLRIFNELPFFLLIGIVLTVYSRDTFSGLIGMGLLVALVGAVFVIRAVIKKAKA